MRDYPSIQEVQCEWLQGLCEAQADAVELGMCPQLMAGLPTHQEYVNGTHPTSPAWFFSPFEEPDVVQDELSYGEDGDDGKESEGEDDSDREEESVGDELCEAIAQLPCDDDDIRPSSGISSTVIVPGRCKVYKAKVVAELNRETVGEANLPADRLQRVQVATAASHDSSSISSSSVPLAPSSASSPSSHSSSSSDLPDNSLSVCSVVASHHPQPHHDDSRSPSSSPSSSSSSSSVQSPPSSSEANDTSLIKYCDDCAVICGSGEDVFARFGRVQRIRKRGNVRGFVEYVLPVSIDDSSDGVMVTLNWYTNTDDSLRFTRDGQEHSDVEIGRVICAVSMSFSNSNGSSSYLLDRSHRCIVDNFVSKQKERCRAKAEEKRARSNNKRKRACHEADSDNNVFSVPAGVSKRGRLLNKRFYD